MSNIYLIQNNQVIETYISPQDADIVLIQKHAELMQYQIYNGDYPPPFGLESEVYRIYDTTQNKWVIDYPTKINALKTQLLNNLDLLLSDYKSKYRSKIEYPKGSGIYYDSGIVYQDNLEKILSALSKGTITLASFNSSVVDYNGVPRTVSQTDIQSIHDLIEADIVLKGISLYQQKWTYLNQINSVTTIDQAACDTLNNINIVYN